MLQDIAGATPGAADGLIKDTTTQAFMKDVIEESKRQPVLIDFWAPWCGPCKMVAPEIRKVAAELAGKFLIAKVNTEEVPSLGRRYRVTAIPTMVLFSNGLEVARQAGAMPAPAIKKFIEQTQLAPGDRS